MCQLSDLARCLSHPCCTLWVWAHKLWPTRCSYGVDVSVSSALVREATLAELEEALGSTSLAEARIAARRAVIVAELHRGEGAEEASSALRRVARLPRRRSRVETETAVELLKLQDTWEALNGGQITYDHSGIIAKASSRGKIDEHKLLELATHQPVEQFANSVRQHEQDRSRDEGVSLLKRQRKNRYLKVTEDLNDGMTVIHGRFDPVVGARVRAALSRQTSKMWRREDPRARRSSEQRMADALEVLLTRQGGEGGLQGITLLLIAEYDMVAKRIGSPLLSGGPPLPVGELHKLACDAEVLPAIF